MSKIIKSKNLKDVKIEPLVYDHGSAVEGDIAPFFTKDNFGSANAGSAGVNMFSALNNQNNVSKDVMEIQRRAYEEGFAQGEKNGIKMGEEKLKAIFERFENLFNEIAGLKKNIYLEAEQDLLMLSLEIAKKIVHKAVQVDTEIVQTLVRITLERVAKNSKIKIHLSPLDYEAITRAGDLAEKYKNDFETLEIIPDESVEQGGCYIESTSGIYDARISKQLEEIEKDFLEMLPGEVG